MSCKTEGPYSFNSLPCRTLSKQINQKQNMFQAGVAQCGTDECDFNQVLCLNSLPSLRKILDAYRQLAGTELEDAISAEFSGDIAEGYRAISKNYRRYAYFKILYVALNCFKAGCSEFKMRGVVACVLQKHHGNCLKHGARQTSRTVAYNHMKVLEFIHARSIFFTYI